MNRLTNSCDVLEDRNLLYVYGEELVDRTLVYVYVHSFSFYVYTYHQSYLLTYGMVMVLHEPLR